MARERPPEKAARAKGVVPKAKGRAKVVAKAAEADSLGLRRS